MAAVEPGKVETKRYFSFHILDLLDLLGMSRRRACISFHRFSGTSFITNMEISMLFKPT